MDNGIISDSAFPEKYNTITAPRKRNARSSNMKSNDDNALTSNAADAALKKRKTIVKETKVDTVKVDLDQVALWSERNKHLSGMGPLKAGYNIVNKEAADIWLKVRGVREATPEEVASYYGK